MTLTDLFLFVVLPYVAVGQLLPAALFRARTGWPLGQQAAVPTLAAERGRFWSRPGWIGAAILLALHLLPFLFPGAWSALIESWLRLLLVELTGLVGGLFFLAGIATFLWRRLREAQLSPLRTSLEMAALCALLASALAGVATAATVRWGSAWYARVLGPYLWSLARLQPDLGAVSALGFWPRAHLAFAFLAMALVPFTTLPRQLAAPVRAALGGAR
jgi:nitrate reductase gamma subunit